MNKCPPTPWRYQEESDAYTHIVRAGDRFIFQLAQDTSGEAEATARFIVKACNGHADLVGALRFILAFYEPGQRALDTEAWKRAEAAGRAALAQAEREEEPA